MFQSISDSLWLGYTRPSTSVARKHRIRFRIAAILGACIVGLSGCGPNAEVVLRNPVELVKAKDEDSRDGHSIHVPASKKLAAKVATEAPLNASWEDMRWLPAKIALDPDRHFAITTSVDVVIEEMLVELGTAVPMNEPIFKLSAPEISKFRGAWSTGHNKLRIANQKHEWQLEVQKTIEELSKSLTNDSASASIEQFSKKRLGSHGGKILESLIRWNAAKRMLENAKTVTDGALSNRVLIERETEYAGARALLESTVQQVTFDIAQETLASKVAVDEALAELGSTESELHHIQGSAPPKSTSQDLPVFDPEDPSDPDAFVFRTPRSGILLERFFARGERAQKGETIAIVADLSELWVVGELRTQDWDMIAYPPGSKMRISVPGFESMGTLDAQLVFVGGNVDPTTQAIRLAASVKNPNGLLRPGMHARMSLMNTQGEKTWLVPTSAIFTIMGVDYVLREDDEEHFSLCKVKIGRRNDTQVEILSGLDTSKKVMTQGTFVIASEAFIEEE